MDCFDFELLSSEIAVVGLSSSTSLQKKSRAFKLQLCLCYLSTRLPPKISGQIAILAATFQLDLPQKILEFPDCSCSSVAFQHCRSLQVPRRQMLLDLLQVTP